MEVKSGGSGGSFGLTYDTDKWKQLEFSSQANSFSLCEFIDRDIQCDFENPFWEVTDCNWSQDKSAVSSLGLGTLDQSLSRIKAVDEHKSGNYWKRASALTENHYIHGTNEGTYSLISPSIREFGKRYFYPHFGFAYKAINANVKVFFVETSSGTQVEALNKDHSAVDNNWHYFFKDLSQVPFLQALWDAETEGYWQIVLVFQVSAGGSISVDNIGPCALDEVFFPGSSLTAKRVSSCYWMGVMWSIIFTSLNFKIISFQ